MKRLDTETARDWKGIENMTPKDFRINSMEWTSYEC